jgi:hypothetical protein
MIKKLTVILVTLVVGLWAASIWLISRLFGPPGDAAAFGDMFGAVSALFTGLAFVGVILAIVLQWHELQLQREELQATREELRGQKEQLRTQNETLRKQAFESTFFQLLRTLNEIVSAMNIREPSADASGLTTGRDCFIDYYDDFRESYKTELEATPSGDPAEIIVRSYSRFFVEHQSDVGHYFRMLYNILKFVAQSDVAEKRFYTNLLRAQLSSQELLLLFYNCLSVYGRQKAKPLVEEFSMLEGMPQDRLIGPRHVQLYSPQAYGEDSTRGSKIGRPKPAETGPDSPHADRSS